MGRKDYMNDLATAQYLDLDHIDNVCSGEDGELTFTFDSGTGITGSVTAHVSEVSEYPKSHHYMIFAADDADPSIANAIGEASTFPRKTIPQLLDTLGKHLLKVTATGGRDDPYLVDDDGDVHIAGTSDGEPESDAGEGDYNDDFDADGDNEDWAIQDFDGATHIPAATATSGNFTSTNTSSDRVRNDLLTAKAAGFRVGAQGYLAAGNAGYLSLSCRIDKLGISEEAMQAWSLDPKQYLLLIFYFPGGYKDIQALTSMDKSQVRRDLEMRVGVSDYYKPRSLADALQFFKPNNKSTEQLAEDDLRVRDTFISRPLNNLLNERLLQLINVRLSKSVSWQDAESIYHGLLGSFNDDRSKQMKMDSKPEKLRRTYPQMVLEDELTSIKAMSQVSFPLVAMQFLLRHFVRCTEFCLVCHNKINSDLEAIKPYVCDKPLCLYQYMNLGFGPSMEHEILAQPFVADVLVSFCYASVASSRMRAYPEGLEWNVPHPTAPVTGRRDPSTHYSPYAVNTKPTESPSDSTLQSMRSFSVRLNRAEMQLLFETKLHTLNPLKRGDWIAIIFEDRSDTWYCRVLDTSLYPTVSLDPSGPIKRNTGDVSNANNTGNPPQVPNTPDKENTEPERPTNTWEPVKLHIFEYNFDTFSKASKGTTMLLLMDLLPNVQEMKDYLRANPGATIAGWTSRLPPACIGILRWIIASNRSCIMQVDDLNPVQGDASSLALCEKKGEQRINGFSSWLQFRFAMGAPDKEQRFVDSLSEGNSTYPSFFAWHGSGVDNWHSIIREGLDFKETLHGRAFGHGCYHSPHFQTSSGYSVMAYRGAAGGSTNAWPSSMLKISSAIALSEIVNAPDKFAHKEPHYVIQFVDWIQTRYLFVQPSMKIATAAETALSPEAKLPQDPGRVPQGPTGPMEMPMAALPKSRRPGAKSSRNGTAKSSKKKIVKALPKLTAINLGAVSNGSSKSPIDLDTGSVSTLEEDRALMCEPPPVARPPTPPPSMPATPVTKFKPSTASDLPVMPAPRYATQKATMAITKALRDTMKTQEAHMKDGVLFELGWYLDVARIEQSDNLYQWVVQMHSFPLDIPLGQDMKKAGIDAITFEMRFPASYPFSPPFLRVVSPRFLPFHMGGGGHVTLGGSVCMDLLTSTGWSVAYSIESVLLQVRMALMSTEPKPARLESVVSPSMGSRSFLGALTGSGGSAGKSKGGVYGVSEAVDAFVRACRTHGWTVPPELQEMTRQRIY